MNLDDERVREREGGEQQQSVGLVGERKGAAGGEAGDGACPTVVARSISIVININFNTKTSYTSSKDTKKRNETKSQTYLQYNNTAHIAI